MHHAFIAFTLFASASALLHSHAQPAKPKYAYVTMKFVRSKHEVGSEWRPAKALNFKVASNAFKPFENILDGEELEAEAKELFDPERAEYAIKKARSFKASMESEIEDQKACGEGSARQVARLAKQLSDSGAKYPLVVYTNDVCLMNMTEALPSNVILETNFKYLPRKCAMEGKNSMHFNKLGVFGLTKWDKLMWMDWDLQVKQNIDDLFERDTNNGLTIYGQKDDWKCQGKKDVTKLWSSASGGFCSGLMLFTPRKDTVDALIDNQGKSCWGDQVVIARTFNFKDQGREWKTWDNDVISFRGCQHKFKPRVVHHADLPGNDPGPAWK
jgi:hypothetical protein